LVDPAFPSAVVDEQVEQTPVASSNSEASEINHPVGFPADQGVLLGNLIHSLQRAVRAPVSERTVRVEEQVQEQPQSQPVGVQQQPVLDESGVDEINVFQNLVDENSKENQGVRKAKARLKKIRANQNKKVRQVEPEQAPLIPKGLIPQESRWNQQDQSKVLRRQLPFVTASAWRKPRTVAALVQGLESPRLPPKQDLIPPAKPKLVITIPRADQSVVNLVSSVDSTPSEKEQKVSSGSPVALSQSAKKRAKQARAKAKKAERVKTPTKEAPATPKAVTPKAITPKAVTPKAITPKAVAPVLVSPTNKPEPALPPVATPIPTVTRTPVSILEDERKEQEAPKQTSIRVVIGGDDSGSSFETPGFASNMLSRVTSLPRALRLLWNGGI
jgi:hypothetical protein